MSKKPQCFIFDGNSFMHRAHNSMPSFATKAGFPTGATTGFLNMVTSVIKKFSPEKVIFIFDAKGKNFRHEMYPEYKGNRPPTDPDLKQQFPVVKQIITAWGYPIVCKEGVEADDVMATLAKQAVSADYEAVIVTSDKDMAQEVNDNVLILDTKDADLKGKPYGTQGVFDKMGVYPQNIRDLLAIMGDKADNVPGVEGVGQVTAAKWINQYGGLEDIIAHADELKGSYGQKFRDQIENARLSYKLVVIDNDLDVGIAFDDIEGERNEEDLFELASTYELNKFKNEIGVINLNASSAGFSLYEANADDLYEKAREAGICFMEISQTKNEIVLIAFAGESEIGYFDLVGNEAAAKSFLSDIKTIIAGNDVKRVLKRLSQVAGVSIPSQKLVFDSRVANYVINGGSLKPVSITALNDMYANIELSELRGTQKLDTEKPKWDKLQLEELRNVIAEELEVAKAVFAHEDIVELIRNYNPLKQDLRLLPTLAQMELEGIQIDVEKLGNLKEEFESRLSVIENEVYKLAGKEFNIDSPPQVKAVLFTDLKIPSKKQATDEKTLSKLVDDYPISQLILDYRSLKKLISTYVDGLVKRATKEGVVHTTLNQTVVSTGRLSSKDPNLQNIPIRTEDGRKIREAFIPREGYTILAADYSQIELRILAHGCQQIELIEAFHQGVDIHKATAARIFGITLNEVTAEQRRVGKTVNFGMIYGQGPKSIAEDLGVTLKVAKGYIEAYFVNYDCIKPYMESVLQFAKENLFVETFTGRKLSTRDVNTNNPMVRAHKELAAKNAPIQGTAADIIKEAMIKVASKLDDTDEARLLLQVHDELIFEVKNDKVDEFSLIIKEAMEQVLELDAPLLVDIGTGSNWLEAH